MSISKEADHGFYESNPSVDQEIYSIKLKKVGLIHTITNAIFYKTTNTESLGYVRNIEKMNKLT